MKVLMFGWEFPPHIAGGLGTACEGIVKGLAHNGVDVLFVMPSASGDEDQSCARILNASDVAVSNVSDTVEEFIDKVKFINVDSNIVPYVDPDEYFEAIEQMKKNKVHETTVGFGQKFKFSGKYGANLLEEVSRYAQVGGTIAMQYDGQFDVIPRLAYLPCRYCRQGTHGQAAGGARSRHFIRQRLGRYGGYQSARHREEGYGGRRQGCDRE